MQKECGTITTRVQEVEHMTYKGVFEMVSFIPVSNIHAYNQLVASSS